jgi:MFS family permease
VQGAADAVTWVVGFALLADLYGDEERGRMAGVIMSGTSVAFMRGPSLGGWLYELGGIRLPFLFVAALATAVGAAFVWLDVPPTHATRTAVPIHVVIRTPAIASCAVVVVALSSTLTMLEPVLALHLSSRLGIGPARIGLVFGSAAVATAILNPIYGRLSDRWGARRLMLTGLVLAGLALPLLPHAWSFQSAVSLYVLQASLASLAITPSLAFMGEATSAAGIGSFGVSYGLYNVAWGIGMLAGPAAGGFLFERMGFTRMSLVWAPVVILMASLFARAGRRDTAVHAV